MSTNAPEIKIETGIPVPPRRRRTENLPLDTMQVGESFLIPTNGVNSSVIAGTANRRYAPKRFTGRKIPFEGTRIWRIA